MDEYWGEFAKVALAHALAVASPGPDLSIVLRQSLRHGRRAAIWTSVGIGSGVLLHAGYSLLGIGLVIAGSETWFTILKYAGAGYLTWLGVQSLRSRPRAPETMLAEAGGVRPSARGAFVTGFLTNALNPKATIFFVALFATVISAKTPKGVQAMYGLWMVGTTALWFCAVSVVFAREPLRRAFWTRGHWIDRALGVVFLGFAVSLLLARTN